MKNLDISIVYPKIYFLKCSLIRQFYGNGGIGGIGIPGSEHESRSGSNGCVPGNGGNVIFIARGNLMKESEDDGSESVDEEHVEICGQ